jgi:hypothetical protein
MYRKLRAASLAVRLVEEPVDARELDLQPEIWAVQNGNFLVISPAGRRENSHEGVEIFGKS